MKIMSGKILVVVMCVAVSVLLAMPGVSFSDDPDQTQTRYWEDGGYHLDNLQTKLRLRDCIIDDTGMSEAEMNWYEPLIAETLKLNGGDAKSVREMFRKAVGDECVGDCLMERLRKRNRVMKQEQKQLDGDDQVAGLEGKRDQTGDQNQTRTRDDTDCDPVGDANKNRHGDEAGDLTSDVTSTQAQDSTSDQSGDQSQDRTRDVEECDPVGDENRKGW